MRERGSRVWNNFMVWGGGQRGEVRWGGLSGDAMRWNEARRDKMR